MKMTKKGRKKVKKTAAFSAHFTLKLHINYDALFSILAVQYIFII